MKWRLSALIVRLYDALLMLYPEPFRSAYRAEMRQVFQDCCRASGTWADLLRLWLHCSGDLLVNVIAERLRQMTRLRFWADLLAKLAALLAFGLSNLFLMGVVFWISLAYLMPWELTLPPPGTLAETINNFFLNHETSFLLPILLVLVCEFLALRHNLRARRLRLIWVFALMNALIASLSLLLSWVGRIAAQALIYDAPDALNDPNLNTVCLYGGLMILIGVGLVYLYFSRTALPGRSVLRADQA